MPYVTRPMRYKDCHAIAHMREFIMDASEPQLKKISERLIHLKKPGDEKPGLVPNVYGYVTEYSPSWADINDTMIVSCAMLVPTFSLTEEEKRVGNTDRYDYRVMNLMTNPGHRKSGCASMCLEMSLQWLRQDYKNPNISAGALGYMYKDRQNAENILLKAGFKRTNQSYEHNYVDDPEQCSHCPVDHQLCHGLCSLVLFELINRKDDEKLCVR